MIKPFELIRDAPTGLPIHTLAKCKQWLLFQNFRYYGYNLLSDINETLCGEIHAVAECLLHHSTKASAEMLSPDGTQYKTIDRSLLWFLIVSSIDDYNLPFLLCINSVVQNFIELSDGDKWIIHRQAHQHSYVRHLTERVQPRPYECIFEYKTDSALLRLGVREAVDPEDTDP